MITEENYAESVKNMRNRTIKLEREGDYWTDKERKRLKDLFGDGTGITEIAVLLQRTEPAVMQQIEKLDLYQRKEYPTRSRNTGKPCECLCKAFSLDETACPRRLPLADRQEVK